MTGHDETRAADAAEILIAARSAGSIGTLPASCRPRDEAEAYRIQDAVAARLGPAEGWKVGAGSADAVPNCAPLLAGSVMASPAALDASRLTLRGIEAEIAFRLARDLPPRPEPYTRDEVEGAIEAAFPAIEVCESRLRDWANLDPHSKLADSNMNLALVIGDSWDGWPNLEIARQGFRVAFDDRTVVEQMGGNTAGDLIRLLVWLANHLSERGHGLRRGQVVTTGSWCGLIQAGAAKRVTVSFSGVGDVALSFA